MMNIRRNGNWYRNLSRKLKVRTKQSRDGDVRLHGLGTVWRLFPCDAAFSGEYHLCSCVKKKCYQLWILSALLLPRILKRDTFAGVFIVQYILRMQGSIPLGLSASCGQTHALSIHRDRATQDNCEPQTAAAFNLD